MNYYFINSTNENVDLCIKKLQEHSKYLKLKNQIEVFNLSDTNSLIIAMIFHSNFGEFNCRNTKQKISFEHNIKFDFDINETLTKLEIPMNFQEHFYFESEDTQYFISNDLRFFNKLQEKSIDPKGVYSYFKYKVTEADTSFYTGLKKIQNGYELTIKQNHSPEIKLSKQTKELFTKKDKSGDIKQKVFNSLTEVINKTPQNSIMFFSGGIDSTILALAAKESNRNDITLLNCSFGENDSSAKLAQKTAEKLDMNLKQVYFEESKLEDIFKNIHKIFSKPFIDVATLPTVFLTNEAEKVFIDNNGAFIDGSIADSSFGGYGHKYAHKYKKILSLPLFTRQVASICYDKFNVWKNYNKLEVILRNIRKTLISDSKFTHIVNPFDNLLYLSNPDITNSLQQNMSTLIEPINVEQEVQPDLIKMFYATCLFRTTHPALYNGRNVVYPFFEPDLINQAFSLDTEQRFNTKQGKLILREIIKDKMPEYPGFNISSSFIPSFSSVFKSSSIKNIVENIVLNDSNEILKYIDIKKFKQIWNYIQTTDKELSTECIDIIWGVIFISYWFNEDIQI